MNRLHDLIVTYTPNAIVRIIGLVVFIIFIAACNNERKQSSINSNSEAISSQVFLIGNEAGLKEPISDMIKKAGIKKGGYVVIIPTSFTANNKKANAIRKQFNDQNIMAVHILKFNPKSAIKNTDIITIKNASIICFLGQNPNRFMEFANSTSIKESLFTASENGALIAGFGKASSILGEYFYVQGKIDTTTNMNKIWLKPGLGILKNTVVDDISIIKSRKKTIHKKSIKKDFLFIGLGKRSSILIEDSVGIVRNKHGIKLISPDKELTKLGKGDEFRLIPQ